MTRHAAASALLAAAIATATSAGAATIVHNDTITGVGPTATALLGFPEFDPALGTLDSVGIEISGVLNASVVLLPFQTILPLVAFDAIGAGGRGFDFAGNGATFVLGTFTNPSTTAPLPVTVATSFTMTFLIDAFSDLAGVIVPATSSAVGTLVPPVNVAARRSDFIRGIVPIGVSETLTFTPTGFVASNITVGGAVTVTYTYTPAVVPAPIPAPGAAVLLAAVPLLLRRRRRKRGSSRGD
jgi:hypothetical protein